MDEVILHQTLDNRSKGWVDLSHKLFGLKEAPHFMVNIQMCGRIDVKICEMELKLKANDDSNLFAHTDAIDLSKLWVCFFYETLRAYRNFNGWKKTEDYWFKEVLNKLSNLRMPMAKLQAQGVFSYKEGYHVESPIFFPKIPSTGWIVYSADSRQHCIPRQSLANEFLMAGKEKLKEF